MGPISASTPCLDLGQAWGVCSIDKPKLPGLGFEYDADILTRTLLLTLPELFSEHPGCGSMPVAFRSNRAGRHGGGLFQQDCDEGIKQKGLCWVGGISDQASSSFIVSFEANIAGGAGGSIYTTCFSLDICQEVTKMSIGLPTSSKGKVLSFLSNEAGGYGEDLATAPSDLVLGASQRNYVPGKTMLDVTFFMLDATGQVVVGSELQPISHMVHLHVLPATADCTTVYSCDLLRLQTPIYFLSNGKQKMTSTRDFNHNVPLMYCPLGAKSSVDIRLFVSPSSLLDAPSDLVSLQKTITVSCSPCEPGWTKVTDGQLWTCTQCDLSEYIIDPNIFGCQPCPGVCA